MTWVSISDVVQRLWPHRNSVPPEADIRVRAAALAGAVYGPGTVMAEPTLINLAALALAMDRLIVYRLTADAAEQVRATELLSIPGQPPGLLRRPFIIESRRPEKFTLFGRTAALAGYPLDDKLYLVGFDYPDGARVEPVRIDWREQDIEAITIESPLVQGDIAAHRAWAVEVAEWIVTLGALLEAEGTPLVAADWLEGPAHQRQQRGQRGTSRGAGNSWLIRRVSLAQEAVRRVQSRAEAATTELHADAQARREGLILRETWVRGHLRRQPYGPGRELRKWVYIEGYEARRWMSARPLRIDVDVG